MILAEARTFSTEKRQEAHEASKDHVYREEACCPHDFVLKGCMNFCSS
jgi:hypothetical protein